MPRCPDHPTREIRRLAGRSINRRQSVSRLPSVVERFGTKLIQRYNQEPSGGTANV